MLDVNVSRPFHSVTFIFPQGAPTASKPLGGLGAIQDPLSYAGYMILRTVPPDTLENIQLPGCFKNVPPKSFVLIRPLHSDKWPVRHTRLLNQAPAEHWFRHFCLLQQCDPPTVFICMHRIIYTVWYLEADSQPSKNIMQLRFGRNYTIPHPIGRFTAWQSSCENCCCKRVWEDTCCTVQTFCS